jgi:ADP-heptose:LPS heptosyltransferase
MELFARISTLLSYLSGAKIRIGYHRFHNEGLYRGGLITHKVEYNPHIHMAYNLLNLLYACGSPPQELPLPKRPVTEDDLLLPRYAASEDEKKGVRAKLAMERESESGQNTIILLNPNASDLIPLRKWPLDNYIQLARKLLENPQIEIVLTGTAAEKAKAEAIRKTLASPRCLNLAGKTTFTELMSLYCLADILVTNDSGPVHFSSLTDIHTVALFGPETPKLYGPLDKNHLILYSDYSCSPCVSAFNHRKSPCHNNLCLQAITVEDVFNQIQTILSRKQERW